MTIPWETLPPPVFHHEVRGGGILVRDRGEWLVLVVWDKDDCDSASWHFDNPDEAEELARVLLAWAERQRA